MSLSRPCPCKTPKTLTRAAEFVSQAFCVTLTFATYFVDVVSVAMTVIQRPLKGSRISSFYPVKSVPPLSSLDSAFQLQEYISLLIRSDVHDVEAIVSLPGPSHAIEREGSDEEKNAEKDGKGEVAVDESCWVYEQLR